MIKVICDSCNKSLEDTQGGMTESWDKRITLQISLNTRGDLLDMDLCPRCTKKYIAVLKGEGKDDGV